MTQEAEPAREPQPSTALVRISLDPQALIHAAIEKGSGIETLERLVALAKDVRAEQAREAWHAAMSEFQRRCPKIRRSATAKIASRRTGAAFSYSYAPLSEIVTTIAPVLGAVGLSVSFRVRYEPERVIASCRVSHELGHHEESGDVAMPVVGDDGAGASPPQRVGIASTYAKRYALLAILGLAPQDDAPPRQGQGQQGATPAPPARQVWTGAVRRVSSEATGGLWTVVGEDGTQYGTPDKAAADFAREAGTSWIRIVWEQTPKFRKIVAIEPAVSRETGDEGPDA